MWTSHRRTPRLLCLIPFGGGVRTSVGNFKAQTGLRPLPPLHPVSQIPEGIPCLALPHDFQIRSPGPEWRLLARVSSEWLVIYIYLLCIYLFIWIQFLLIWFKPDHNKKIQWPYICLITFKTIQPLNKLTEKRYFWNIWEKQNVVWTIMIYV